MASADVVVLLLLIGGQSPQTSPADNSSSIQVVHVPPVSDVPPVSAVPPVSCVPPVSDVPPLPEKYPTMQWCGKLNISADSQLTHYHGTQWALTNSTDAAKFEGRAVVGGYEEQGSPLWVIRACIYAVLIPGKFSTKHKEASVTYGDEVHVVDEFEVLLSQPGRVSWVADEIGIANAIPGSLVESFHTVFIGRAKHEGFIINGWVAPDELVLYSSFNGSTTSHMQYEILTADWPVMHFPHLKYYFS